MRIGWMRITPGGAPGTMPSPAWSGKGRLGPAAHLDRAGLPRRQDIVDNEGNASVRQDVCALLCRRIAVSSDVDRAGCLVDAEADRSYLRRPIGADGG
jgi:hypothetical protein